MIFCKLFLTQANLFNVNFAINQSSCWYPSDSLTFFQASGSGNEGGHSIRDWPVRTGFKSRLREIFWVRNDLNDTASLPSEHNWIVNNYHIIIGLVMIIILYIITYLSPNCNTNWSIKARKRLKYTRKSHTWWSGGHGFYSH